jgi:hypothetical protein
MSADADVGADVDVGADADVAEGQTATKPSYHLGWEEFRILRRWGEFRILRRWGESRILRRWGESRILRRWGESRIQRAALTNPRGRGRWPTPKTGMGPRVVARRRRQQQ